MKKKVIIIVSVVALVLGAVAGGFFANHTWVDGQLVHKNTESFQWKSKTLSRPEALQKLPRLKTLNVEAAAITPAEYEALKASLPGCDIQWMVPFQGAYYAEDVQQITVSTLREDAIDSLAYLPNLTTINVQDCTDYAALQALQSRYPQLTVYYELKLEDLVLTPDTTELTIADAPVAQLEQALEALPGLRSITLTDCQDPIGIRALAQRHPGRSFAYTIPLGERRLAQDVAELTVEPGELEALKAVLPAFTGLKDVTVTGDTLDIDVHDLALNNPGTRFHYSFRLLGLEVHTDQDFLDLSGIKMENTQELEAALPYFHNLTKVDMVSCGLENEAMAALNDRHPGTLFVWKVLIGEFYYRTDITSFYPTGSHISLVHQDISNLKYCTELVVLDLGHFLVSDCSFVEYMPKLEYLVLAIGPLKDIRPVGTLKELKFLEIFSTKVTDYWPLLNCTSLEDLNISFSGHGDITPLLQMPWLNRLWLCDNKLVFSEEEQAILAQHLPNTILLFSSGSATNKGWRNSPGYYGMRDFLDGFYLIA